MKRQILQIIACYIMGLVAGNLIFMPYSGSLALLLPFVGAIYALPFLILVVVVFALMRDGILRHPAIWCIFAPCLIVTIWLLVEWKAIYSHRGHDIYWYLSLRNVWERAALALTCASASSAIFWRWNRTLPIAGRERTNNSRGN